MHLPWEPFRSSMIKKNIILYSAFGLSCLSLKYFFSKKKIFFIYNHARSWQTLIRLVSISAKFGICSAVGLHKWDTYWS
jgi:hypothetical protein